MAARTLKAVRPMMMSRQNPYAMMSNVLIFSPHKFNDLIQTLSFTPVAVKRQSGMT
jgi:hypothetical protein